jgi:HNH endonuclease
MDGRRVNGPAPTPESEVPMQDQPNEIVCPCGITFEPLPWFNEDLDESVCDECAMIPSCGYCGDRLPSGKRRDTKWCSDRCRGAARPDGYNRGRRYPMGEVRRERLAGMHGTRVAYIHLTCRCDLCRQANSEYLRDYRNGRKRERLLAKKRAWSKRRTPAQRRAESTTEQNVARTKAWRAANPERARELDRRKVRAYAHRKRAGGGYVAERDWQRLLNRYDGRCAYCRMARATDQDHVIPLSRGGRHMIGNILPACRNCNAQKQARLPIEWRTSR